MSYTISLVLNGGTTTGSTTITTDNGYFALPSDPYKKDYVFDSWYKDVSLKTPFNISTDTPVTNNITLYAGYISTVMTVQFLNSDNTVLAVEYVHMNDCVSNTHTPTKEGYDFSGWYTDSKLTNVFSYNDAVTTNLKLYPKFVPITFTVSFVSEKSMPEYKNISAAYGTTITKPDEIKFTGYSLTGFYLDSNFTMPYDFSSTIAKNLILYVKYTETVYLVNFKVDDEVVYQSVVLFNQKAKFITPNENIKVGYRFQYWTLDKVKYDFNTILTKSIDLVATFIPIVSTVKFDLGGGIGLIPNQSVDYGKKITAVTNPTKVGYDFDYWSTNASGTVKFNDDNIYEDTMLYAVYKPQTFTVAYLESDYSVYALEKVLYNHCTPLLDPPSKENYNFLYWRDKDIDEPFIFNTPITTDVTLIPAFDAKKVSLVFNTYGGTFITPKVLAAGTIPETPDDPKKDGSTFVNWYTSSDFTTVFDFSKPLKTSESVYASWKTDVFTVTLNYNDDTGKTETYNIEYGEVLPTTITPLTKSGKVFSKWTVDNKDFDLLTPITADIVIEGEFVEYVAESSDQFIVMLKSNKYYKGADINYAIKNFLEGSTQIEYELNLQVSTFGAIYDWAVSKNDFFPPTEYFALSIEGDVVQYTSRTYTYTLNASYQDIETMIKILSGGTCTETQKLSLSKYLTTVKSSILSNTYNSTT